MKRIFFAGHEAGKFPDGRMELQISFAGKRVQPYMGDTSEYVWTPKWDDLQLVFLLSYTVERLNKGNHFKLF